MRILFITATRLGDAVLSTGLLDHLLRAHPEARFTIACGPVAAGVFARMPRLERLIEVDKRKFDLHWLTLWASCVGTQWDLAVDLRGSALTLLLPARRRAIMRGGRRPGHRLTHLAGTLGLADPPCRWLGPSQRITQSPLPSCRRRAPDRPGPTANWDGKIWPPDRFVALFQALASQMHGARAGHLRRPRCCRARAAADVLAAIPPPST